MAEHVPYAPHRLEDDDLAEKRYLAAILSHADRDTRFINPRGQAITVKARIEREHLRRSPIAKTPAGLAAIGLAGLALVGVGTTIWVLGRVGETRCTVPEQHIQAAEQSYQPKHRKPEGDKETKDASLNSRPPAHGAPAADQSTDDTPKLIVDASLPGIVGISASVRPDVGTVLATVLSSLDGRPQADLPPAAKIDLSLLGADLAQVQLLGGTPVVVQIAK